MIYFFPDHKLGMHGELIRRRSHAEATRHDRHEKLYTFSAQGIAFTTRVVATSSGLAHECCTTKV